MSGLKLKKRSGHPNFPELEEKVIAFWQENRVFEKSVESRPEDKPYVFYDGPPFATGLPHYGHLLASTIKDVIPRYWTMKGHRVERVWGWDCHGLPIENIVEQELDLKDGKKGIEEYGIKNFNDACRNAIWRFDKEWEIVIERLGRWVDFKNSYKTMDTSYMESVWWAFSQLHQKGLVYQGHKVILYCPRCSTPLSNFEIAMDNSYQMVKDNSVTVKFPLKGSKNTYFLAWTTTPWTLIGNVGLAVHPEHIYVKIKQDNEYYWLAKDRLEVIQDDYTIEEETPGARLENTEYQPLYSYLDTGDKKAWYVAVADFVSMEEGTGIVHTAAMYGEDDFELAKKVDLPLVTMLDEQGHFMDMVTPLKGKFFKNSEKWIIQDLESKNLMYDAKKFTHSYPFCYRCETPLYYTGIPAWFIDVQKIKGQLIKANQSISWFPDHLKHGRFGKGLETAPDWNISRSRYWGTPMPVWVDEDSGNMRVIGSIKELKEWAVDPQQVKDIDDIHREYVDEILVWVDDDRTIKGKRIQEVFDCWVESGSMPYASEHYPFENKERFKKRHPAQFISEYIAQTRAWFYTLHVMSVGLFDTHTFENALTTGTILAEDGQKMSKSKKNFPDPMKLIDKYGVDSLRMYLMSSTVMKAENLNFQESKVDEIRKKVFNIFYNVFSFYQLYNNDQTTIGFPEKPEHVMDTWLISQTQKLIQSVTESMDSYDVVTASRELMDFVADLSTWWLRLSRDRIRDSQSNQEVLQVFRTVLVYWCQLAAPFAPFFTEIIYQNVTNTTDSVHLTDWPQANSDQIDLKLEEEMVEVRKAVEKTHAIRKDQGIKTRQPLSSLTVYSNLDAPKVNLLEVLADEVNVKKVQWYAADSLIVELDTNLSPELVKEGKAREIIRQIQGMRRKAGTRMDERIDVVLTDWPKEHEDQIKDHCLIRNLKSGAEPQLTRFESE